MSKRDKYRDPWQRSLGHGQNYVKYHSNQSYLRKDKAPTPNPLAMDNNCVNLNSSYYCKYFLLCIHIGLDLCQHDLSQGHDTALGNEQQLCEKLSKTKKPMNRYNHNMHYGYVTLNLDLEIWNLDKIVTHRVLRCPPPPPPPPAFRVASHSEATRNAGCLKTLCRDTYFDRGQNLCKISS